MEEIKEEYEEIRDEHYDSLKVREMSLGVTITPAKVAVFVSFLSTGDSAKMLRPYFVLV